MVRVSIIVPVYNVEQYLETCLSSIVGQTLREIEIILVNDGSSDHSLDICHEYQKKDHRIKLISQENKGVSAARNAGLKAAQGEYIGFVDPDDWIERQMYAELYRKAKEKEAEVVICNCASHCNHENIGNDEGIKKQFISGMISESSLNSNGTKIIGSVWRLLIKRDVLVRNNIKFPVGVVIGEDLIFSIHLLLHTTFFVTVTEVLYHYLAHEDTATTRYYSSMAEVQKSTYHILEHLLLEHEVYKAFKHRMDIRYVNMYIACFINELHYNSPKSKREQILHIYNMCSDVRLRRIIRKTDKKGYTFRKKVVLFCILHRLSTVIFLYYYAFWYLKKRGRGLYEPDT